MHMIVKRESYPPKWLEEKVNRIVAAYFQLKGFEMPAYFYDEKSETLLDIIATRLREINEEHHFCRKDALEKLLKQDKGQESEATHES